MDTSPTSTIIPALAGRRILLGVSGSIAAYKAADLASRLTQAGALVDVILSQSAQQFVTPLTFLGGSFYAIGMLPPDPEAAAAQLLALLGRG